MTEFEAVQRKVNRLIAIKCNRSYEQRLADLDLLSLESCCILSH